MLTVAVPNKGALGEPARQMLAEAGYLRASKGSELLVTDEVNGTEFFFLRPRDVAIYVGAGRIDVGITGRDMLLDSGAAADEVLTLGFAASTFRLAAPAGSGGSLADFAGRRIATAYPGLLKSELAVAGVDATIVTLDGAVENAVALGVADAVADVVDTGSTLRKANLEVVGDPLLRSEAVLITPTGRPTDAAAEVFIRRLQGVIHARAYVMLDYDIRAEHLDAASTHTPGFESPTISPLREEGWFAVRAMVARSEVHATMDALYQLGARGIIVTDIAACRL